jgi:hypothetical protein
VAGFCEHGNKPSGSTKKAGYCLTSSVTISFSKNILQHSPDRLCHGILTQTTKIMIAEPEVSMPIIRRPAVGHDPESAPSTSHRHNL